MSNEKALSLFVAMCRRREDLRTFYASTYRESMSSVRAAHDPILDNLPLTMEHRH